ncbi:MAG: heavy-metal-associated domain-containing protein [Candidatus Ancillula trichonymphae]|nr:heavy-metal-associated domain-containing protein [Candidatus Ancillula trichonymphae]
MEVEDFPVEGMTCSVCVRHVEKALYSLDAVESASVNLATERATVEFDASKLTTADIQSAVESAGYVAKLVAKTDARTDWSFGCFG